MRLFHCPSAKGIPPPFVEVAITDWMTSKKIAGVTEIVGASLYDTLTLTWPPEHACNCRHCSVAVTVPRLKFFERNMGSALRGLMDTNLQMGNSLPGSQCLVIDRIRCEAFAPAISSWFAREITHRMWKGIARYASIQLLINQKIYLQQTAWDISEEGWRCDPPMVLYGYQWFSGEMDFPFLAPLTTPIEIRLHLEGWLGRPVV